MIGAEPSELAVKRILVTGASGTVGREVVVQLRAAGVPVRALSRRPTPRTTADDVEVVHGDLTAADSLDEALVDVDSVFLVWVSPLAAAAPAIARIAARVQRIVLLSSPHRTPHPFFQQPNTLRATHAAVDELVQNSGVEWTILRPAPFASNCRNWWAPQIRRGNVVRWFYGAAQTAPIHERDIAAVATRSLREAGHHEREYLVTGPQSLTQREQLAIIGETIGRPLEFDEMAPATARREVMALFEELFPSAAPRAAIEAVTGNVADMLLSAYAAAINVSALVTSTVSDVTGTQARTFRQWAIDHASAFM